MRLDNISKTQTANMFFVRDLIAAGDPITSLAFDVRQFNQGYMIILNAILLGAGTFKFEIQTSESSGSGFVTVADQELIGGAIPTMTSTIFPGNGPISFTRGLIATRPFVRVRFNDYNNLQSTTSASATLIGDLDVAPSKLAAGTVIGL